MSRSYVGQTLEFGDVFIFCRSLSPYPRKVEKDFRERRLMPELSEILNWALKGLAAYHQQGLNPPEAVRASTQDYCKDMDVVGQWIEERCELDPQACVPTSWAYNDYSHWAADEVGWEIKKLTFRRHLSDRGFTAEKGTHGQRISNEFQDDPGFAPEIITTAANCTHANPPKRPCNRKVTKNF